MSLHTTFRTGGPADIFLSPADENDLAQMLGILRQAGVQILVIGNGSNILVSDRGIRGAVIRLTPNFGEISQEGDTIIAGAGAKLWQVTKFAATASLSGLESTMGIPGTIGGALVMNAGTDHGCISDLVECVTVLNSVGKMQIKCHDELGFKYRESSLQGGGQIVISTLLRLTPGSAHEIHDKMERLKQKRTSRQPTDCHTAGSTFKNPPVIVDGKQLAAGKLIDQAGAKGWRVGGAEVSQKHANFIIAHKGATSTDIRSLAEWMQERVLAEKGFDLEREIELIGDWTGWEKHTEAIPPVAI